VARFSAGKMIHETQVVDAMRGLVENLKQQARTDLSTEDLKDSDPDLKYEFKPSLITYQIHLIQWFNI